jgi:RNA polymerase sigma-70 factor (ECF subfamily)
VADCDVMASDAASATPPDAATPHSHSAAFWTAGLTFEQALTRARTRDAEAISLLYRRFLPVVYRFLLLRVGDVPSAEDLTSETFFAVMEGIARVRAQDELGFASWILGIARNKLAQHFRRRARGREIPMAFPDGAEPASTAEEDDPLAVLTARERWAEVVAALNLLTAEQRTVLLHRCILGESTDTVAHLLGKPANAIYGLQFRALAALARHLKEPPQPSAQHRDAADTIDEGPATERRRGHAAR